MRITTKNSKQTQKLGELLGQEIVRSSASNKRAVVLSLEGDLGSGKTTFTQGLAEGLGIKKIPRSPTFIIMQAFEITPPKKHFHLVHIDAYRISGKDLKTLGWNDLIKNKKNIIAIEWGTRVKKFLPKRAVKIKFAHGRKENERMVSFYP